MRVVVGRIGRPHGLRGDVTVEVRTDEPDRHFAAGSVLLTERGPLTVEQVRWSARPAMRFAEIADRTAAEQWRDVLLEIDRDEHEVPEDPDEFYDHHLVGLQAVVAGEVVGTVREVVHLPSQDLLAVSLVDGREVLVPFVTQVVPHVDLGGGRVVIDPPEGLLELQ